MLMIMLARKAVQRLANILPSSDKDPLSHTTSSSIAVFITRVNKPRVTSVMGSVNNFTIGRMMALTKPKMMETINKLMIFPSKLKPETTVAASQMAKALITSRNNNFTGNFPP